MGSWMVQSSAMENLMSEFMKMGRRSLTVHWKVVKIMTVAKAVGLLEREKDANCLMVCRYLSAVNLVLLLANLMDLKIL